MIERFYDCDAGTIEIDGSNIKNYNLKYSFKEHKFN